MSPQEFSDAVPDPAKREHSDAVIPTDRLPAGFAERIDDPPPQPARPRPAATLVLLRKGSAGLEVLLLRRTRASGFVPGAYVFPGGRVDGEDATPEVLARVDGLTDEGAASRLRLIDGTPPAVAYYLAAVREAFEETGILIGRTSGGEHPPAGAESARVRDLREGLMEGALRFDEVLDRLDCRIDGSAIEYVAHWITPIVEPRRYDTRFFAAEVPAGAEPVLDPREMVDAVWITPSEALVRHRSGVLPMVFPTVRTLADLAPFPGPAEVCAAFRGRDIPTILPRLTRTPEGVMLEIPEVTED